MHVYRLQQPLCLAALASPAAPVCNCHRAHSHCHGTLKSREAAVTLGLSCLLSVAIACTIRLSILIYDSDMVGWKYNALIAIMSEIVEVEMFVEVAGTCRPIEFFDRSLLN